MELDPSHDQPRVPLPGRVEPRSPPAADEASPETKAKIHRTRTGCRTCRCRRVKCDETKPVCAQCRRGKRTCEWPGPDERRARIVRRPNATACDACRTKKLKCTGNIGDVCNRCSGMGIECVRSQQEGKTEHQSIGIHSRSSAALPHPSTSPSYVSGSEAERRTPIVSPFPPGSTQNDGPPGYRPLGELPPAEELRELVQLYFSSVHHFGFFAFIHELNFIRLLDKGKTPRELTLLMIASATRFAGKPTPENLARADAWADAAIETVVPSIRQGFGALQLMALLLAQHYDQNRGNVTSAWLLGADCTRMMQMMSLQTFDRTFPANFVPDPRLSPLLSREALRRVAWATFYADTMIDGGRYGFHTVDEKAYRIQLPCDQATFLSNEAVVTEHLYPNRPNPDKPNNLNLERVPLDMSAYLIRTAAARRRALHFAFRASHWEETPEALAKELTTLEADMEEVIANLPRRFQFNTDNMFLHSSRLSTFILLHVLRHNLFIVTGRAALQVFLRDPAKVDLIPQVRQKRISHALPIAGLFAEGIKADVRFDPHLGVQAYVALEILLFEPRRLAETNPSIDPKSPELMEAIPHLLAAIRDLAARSEIIRRMHIEAVHRLLRCGCADLLVQSDLSSFLSEYQLVGQDPAEYNFHDFRWARLERLRRGGASSSENVAHDEALLEYKVGGETAAPSAAPSPRLDAMDVVRPTATDSSEMHSDLNLSGLQNTDGVGMMQPAQPGWGFAEVGGTNENYPVDWSWWNWLLGESGNPGDQTGDPTAFWNQL